MADKPDYTKANPQLAMTLGDQIIPTGIRMHVYQEDGSPKNAVAPRPSEVHDMLQKVVGLMEPDVDARRAFLFISLMEEVLADGIRQAMMSHHAAVHSGHEAFKDYDEDVLCDGISAYMSNVVSPEPEQPTEHSDLAGLQPANAVPA